MSVPEPREQDAHVVSYASDTSDTPQEAGVLQLRRTLKIDFNLLDVQYYPTLRSFFQIVRNTDEQPAMLQPPAADAAR